jgi:hypothetical protein
MMARAIMTAGPSPGRTAIEASRRPGARQRGAARQTKNDRKRDVLGDVVKGAIAGFAGMKVMEQTTTFMYQHEDPAARQRYQEVTGGKYTPERTAEAVEEALHLNLSATQHKMLAMRSHQMVGLGAGIAYALARRRFGWADTGQGLLFGTLFALVFDEGLTPLFGFAEPPRSYPWQAHARGFAGHLAFGLTADTVLDALDAVA